MIRMGVTGLAKGGDPQEGQTFRVGNYDTEVDRQVGYDECVPKWNEADGRFRAATSVLNKQGIASVPTFMSPNVSRLGPSRGLVKNFKTPTAVAKPHQTSGFTAHKEEDDLDIPASATPLPSVGAPQQSSDLSRAPYKKPTMTPTATEAAKIIIGEHANKNRANWGGAVHDPNAEGAVVMPRPPEEWAKKM
jgi:DNA repair and recombination protein RAD54B